MMTGAVDLVSPGNEGENNKEHTHGAVERSYSLITSETKQLQNYTRQLANCIARMLGC
jgi:hypothetical protein